MSERIFGHLSDIKVAFKKLNMYNDYLWFSVDEQTFNNPLLVEYFEKPFDDPIEARVEKIISAAAVAAVYDNPHISDKQKKRIADKNAKDLRNAMRLAKLDYHAYVKDDISVKNYARRRQGIELVERIAMAKRLKKIKKHLTIRGLADLMTSSLGLPPVGGWVVTGSRMVWSLVPQRVRKPLEQKAKEIKQKTVTVIRNTCDEIKESFQNSKVGKKVIATVEKAKPYLEKVKNKVVAVKETVKDKVKSLLSRFF